MEPNFNKDEFKRRFYESQDKDPEDYEPNFFENLMRKIMPKLAERLYYRFSTQGIAQALRKYSEMFKN